MRFMFASRCAVVLMCAALAAPTWADSFASSASSAGSASIGSVSDSIGRSSKSSTRDTQTADGDYRVIEVAELTDRAGIVQLTLQATAPVVGQGERDEFLLRVPRDALQPRGIGAGDVVHVRNREYGLEFARTLPGQARAAFFLALRDDWHRELDSRAVSL